LYRPAPKAQAEAPNVIDVGDKPITRREAQAVGRITMRPETLAAIREGRVPKGDVLAAARLAGIQAAKKTADLIPLCHPLVLDAVSVEAQPLDEASAVEIRACVRLEGRTGAEMEALCAVAVAALTIYDMCKGLDPEMIISEVKLLRKSGGKSGTWERGG
jgi:cyclic pyranopterin phosphate synthase